MSNLTKRPITPKADLGEKKPTMKQREYWERVRALRCLICGRPALIHHAETGGGGRKNHEKVLPLCWNHHQGDEGIHTIGRKKWEALFGTEEFWLYFVRKKLGRPS